MSNTTPKHWAHYLPFAGRPIQRSADAQELLALRIQEAKNKLAQMEQEYNMHESELEAMVQKDWTNEEIFTAKTKAGTEHSKRVKATQEVEDDEPYFV